MYRVVLPLFPLSSVLYRLNWSEVSISCTLKLYEYLDRLVKVKDIFFELSVRVANLNSSLRPTHLVYYACAPDHPDALADVFERHVPK